VNTKELETKIRDSLFEYQTDPVSSLYLIRVLNEAYRFVYQHQVKSNDTLFGDVYELPVVAGQSEYPMPEGIWSKRIEHFQIPTPPNDSSEAWGWEKLQKMDWKQSYRYQTKRIRTYYPSCWSQLNNKIYVYPPPLVGFTAKMVISRRLVPLGVYGGRITELGYNDLTVEELYDDRLVANVSTSSLAYISICDHTTGELKALFPYNAINQTTKKITLSGPSAGRGYSSRQFQYLRLTAVTAGDTGDDIRLKIVTVGAGAAIVASVSGNDITVDLAAAAAKSTAAVAAAINGLPAAAALVTASPSADPGTTTMVDTTDFQNLFGGTQKYMDHEVSEVPGSDWGTIEVDDFVCFGVATAVSIAGETFDSFLTDWATMKVRGSLNETDPEVLNSLKLQLQELSGDTAGRVLGLKINRSVYNNWGSRPYRK
jgi:hypothetical protein